MSADLPAPDADAAAISAELVERIRAAIAEAGGVLPFHRYMQMALYEPGLGYYAGGSHKLGAGGDFVTAPEISPWFGYCLAREAAPVLETLEGGEVLEPGAGSGRMAADVLTELERLGALPATYRILEVSAELRDRQQRTLAERVPHLADRVAWVDDIPAGFRGVVLANEVLDAMPVHRFRITGNGPVELGVADSDQGLVTAEMGPAGERLAAAIAAAEAAVGELPVDYESEVGLAAADWVATLGERLESGRAILVDYGFPRHEFYHPQRATGTLMGHYRHHAHADPYLYPGLSDLTAHVDFTAAAEAAHGAGLQVAGFATQAHYLMSLGLAEAAEQVNPVDQRAQLEAARAMRTLTMPEEMGELFKVLILDRGELPVPAGLALRDMRGRL
ncbi:MAG: class I SAM-dependent methyltransferase [Pseudomonadota bacterium]